MKRKKWWEYFEQNRRLRIFYSDDAIEPCDVAPLISVTGGMTQVSVHRDLHQYDVYACEIKLIKTSLDELPMSYRIIYR